MHCVGPGSLRGSEHSGPSSASHGETRSTLLSQKVWKAPPQNHIIHLVFWRYGWQIIQLFQQVWKEYGVILTGATSAVCS